MKIKILTVGKPKVYVNEIAEYAKRVGRFSDVTLIHIKENKDTETKLLQNIDDSYCVLLDEKGKEYTSVEFADYLGSLEQSSYKTVSFVIGGPDGHTTAIRERADTTLRLSKLTFPHDLALLIFLETLYRSLTISAGHPYHRV